LLIPVALLRCVQVAKVNQQLATSNASAASNLQSG
jgi:hypothetical protein